ncbi:hypothetical protein L9F63_017974 [Diploptera punctata]|uniref:VWFA domain-containing protein n=1 Tax=Diploptera punctata TaxID=6984 RepID=A0AAD7ZXK7_DIPPU|nr:hypothetical protein L9F63_017974 [Diploptera punctata]
MQPWFLEAAMNSKDVVIIVENSESMSREKHKLAHHIVNSILDSLGNNDFVNVMKVGNNAEAVVDCFQGLVQATPGNVLEFKHALKYLKRAGTAQFDKAIIQAFNILLEANENGHGALCCNRAIMIVAEKMTNTYDDIFRSYNDQESSMRVRVYTYHVSDEQAQESHEMKFISCMNQGGYEQISSTDEITEKISHYVAGMSRPLVNPLEGHAMSLRKSQFVSEEENTFNIAPVFPDAMAQEAPFNPQGYRLMTSVSMPVLDIGENETRLVGVAGTDIPIEDIKKLLLSYKVGVNGYAFLVTNNGHLLVHPDIRPEILGTLKPIHNSVDLTEVEFMDDSDNGQNNFIQLRNALINGETGKMTLKMKYHYDNMRRVSNMLRLYLYTSITETPFSLVLALPRPHANFRAMVPDDKVEFFTRNLGFTASIILIRHVNTKVPEDELSHFVELRGLPCSHNQYFTRTEYRRTYPLLNSQVEL